MHRNIRLLAWFNFLSDFRLYAPVAILYFAQVAGSYALGMSVFAVVMLTSALAELPTGLFSDLIGRKRTVIAGGLASIASVLGYALAWHSGEAAYAVLLVGAACEGIARAFHSGNNAALLYDTLAETGQTQAYQEHLGKTSSMFQAALALSALIGGLIAALSFPAVMWLSVVPQVMALGVALRFVEPRAHSTPANPVRHLRTALVLTWHSPRLRLLNAAGIISFSVGEAAYQFRSAFIALLWPVWAIGIARMLSSIFAGLGFYFSGRIIQRFGEFRLLVGGIIASDTLNILCIALPTPLSPALMSANSVFFGINTVAANGLMQHEFTPEQRATMGSITAFGGSLVYAPVALLMGALADEIGVIVTLLLAQCMGFVVAGLYATVFRVPVAHQPAST